jgi:hypothetical protein
VVETIQIEGNPIPRGVTIGGPANQIFMIPRGSDQLLTFNADFKIEKKMKLEKVLSREDAGEQSLCLALDPKHNRLYASGEYDPKRKWHVWYWDLNDGSFHGEVAAKEGKPGDPMFGGLPGSYKDGWYVYPASGVWFGPDDPEYRFLYTSHTDCGNSHRLDLEKKEVWAMNGPPRGKGGPIKYIFSGPMVGFQPHVGPGWLDNGDFVIPVGGSKRLGLYLYRRVK